MKAKKHRKLLMKSYRKATGLPLPVAALAAKLVARGCPLVRGQVGDARSPGGTSRDRGVPRSRLGLRARGLLHGVFPRRP